MNGLAWSELVRVICIRSKAAGFLCKSSAGNGIQFFLDVPISAKLQTE